MKFRAKLGGNGECFCFKVDKETYIQIKGMERYLQDIVYLKECHEEIQRFEGQTEEQIQLEKDKFVEPVEFEIYPSDVLGYENKDVVYEIELSKNPIDTYTI